MCFVCMCCCIYFVIKVKKWSVLKERKLFDNGEHHIFVVTAAVAIDIIGQRGAKRFFVFFFDGLKRPLNVSLETRV